MSTPPYTKSILAALAVTAVFSCTQPPDYPAEPRIQFLRMSKSVMQQGNNNNDSMWVTIGFTDGDGDLGNNPQDNTQNIFIVDTRDTSIKLGYKAPFVPQQGANNGISGEITFRVFTSCCIYPDGFRNCEPYAKYPTDTLTYQIYIFDRAGHKSNVIETTPIILKCYP